MAIGTVRGVVKIRNDSGNLYNVAELADQSVPAGGEIDLCDPSLPVHYAGYRDAHRLVSGGCPDAQIWADIQAGKIAVVETTPARDKMPWE